MELENIREQKTANQRTPGALLSETLAAVKPLDKEAMAAGARRWSSLAKPLEGLGVLENTITRICGIKGKELFSLDRKILLVMCADNGVVQEGISQTDSSVTAVVTNNFASGRTSACLMSQVAQVEVCAVDVGVKEDTRVFMEKAARGTGNLAKEPAMSREVMLRTVETGIRLARECKEQGFQILLTGEMGIGNTTTSSAMACALLKAPVEEMTGRGAGLSGEGLNHKQEVIRKALAFHRLEEAGPLEILEKVGGLDIAALTGIFLGGAACRLPVVMDGFISAVAALTACRLAPLAGEYILASHCSREPGMKRVLRELGKEPVLFAGMKLGEGTGAVALMPLLEMALKVYREMPTFDGIQITPYEAFTD